MRVFNSVASFIDFMNVLAKISKMKLNGAVLLIKIFDNVASCVLSYYHACCACLLQSVVIQTVSIQNWKVFLYKE